MLNIKKLLTFSIITIFLFSVIAASTKADSDDAKKQSQDGLTSTSSDELAKNINKIVNAELKILKEKYEEKLDNINNEIEDKKELLSAEHSKIKKEIENNIIIMLKKYNDETKNTDSNKLYILLGIKY